ncbi:MAG: AMP-binding protein [Deltaproteobacteria bacterium]|nr:AMP-binding protein [Deltaproteobacteria bacterium]
MLIPLNRTLSELRGTKTLVAFNGRQEFLYSDLLEKVGCFSRLLSKESIGEWVLYSKDSYLFLIGLLSIWQTGSTAVLPINIQSENLKATLKSSRGIVTDLELDIKDKPCLSLLESLSSGPSFVFKELDPDKTALLLHSSGSTGKPKVIKKTLGNLNSELLSWEELLGGKLRKTRCVSTVSHQHIYGLLHRLLWPFCSGRAFFSETIFFPPELVNLMGGTKSYCLVSGPAHLKRMGEALPPKEIKNNLRFIFSSGGPLDKNTALFYQRRFGLTPFEIYGSTETGGMAWRQRTSKADSEAWNLLEQVQIKPSNDSPKLWVSSPFIYQQHDEWWPLDDRVEILSESRFILKGRSDRTVKIEEKRLSLPELEDKLLEHQFIKEVFALSLDASHPAERDQIGIAAVLNAGGISFLNAQGRLGLIALFKKELSKYFEAVLIPRYWRFLDCLPVDEVGKTPLGQVKALFSDRSQKNAPQILMRRETADGLLKKLNVSHELRFFKGHFEHLPCVPGSVQLAWASEALRELISDEIRIKAFESVKFLNLLRPKTTFFLEIKNLETNLRFSFRIWNETLEFSKGIFLLGKVNQTKTL